MIPFWLKLLRSHNGRHGYGLTLPFIIGAYHKYDNKEDISFDDIQRIITSIASETPDESFISLRVCDRLNEPVFAETSSYYRPSDMCTKIYNLDNNEYSLFVAPTIIPNNNGSIKGLSEHLWGKYKEDLQNNKFSYNGGVFTEFNNNDYELISLAKELEDKM